MNQYLVSYEVTMRTIGPVFIGSGKEIGKKEYVFLNQSKVGITDIQDLYKELTQRGKGTAFEEYLLGKGNMGLSDWLKRQNLGINDIKPILKYRLDCGDAIMERGSNRLQIMEYIKDAYGMPYVPGSSLKGMLRTVLLGADICKNPDKYKKEKDNMWGSKNAKSNRNYYLKRNIESIERVAYRKLDRQGTKPGDAVNDILQGLIISDSKPISKERLVLCQKIDRHPDGTERKLPLLRECIKPDTEISFTMTIDTSICKLDGEKLMAAVKLFADSYYDCFVAAFKGMDRLKQNHVLCGGGCGFVSKTIGYPMYGKAEGIAFAQSVFEQTISEKNRQQHKHFRDKQYGASPHIIKCTKYQGKLLQMGICEIKEIKQI